MTIVALTAVPPRFAALSARLGMLLAQDPDRVCLTLPHSYRRFPGWAGDLPELPPGVELLRGADHGPATKFLAVFERYPDRDVLIADDDCSYAPGWLDAFRAARAAHTDAVVAASTYDSARLGLPPGHPIVQGFAGVLLRAAALGPVRTPDDAAIWVDDIWLSAQIARARRPVVACPGAFAGVTAHAAPAALQDAIIDGMNRAQCNRSVAASLQARLGIWRDNPAAPV